MKQKITKYTLLNVAMNVAVRYKYGYRGYETEFKSIKAIQRKCPGFSQGEYRDIYQKGKNIYYLLEKFTKKYGFTIGREYLDLFGQLTNKGRGSRKDWELLVIKRAAAVKQAVAILKKQYRFLNNRAVNSVLLSAMSNAFYWGMER